MQCRQDGVRGEKRTVDSCQQQLVVLFLESVTPVKNGSEGTETLSVRVGVILFWWRRLLPVMLFFSRLAVGIASEAMIGGM